MEEFCEIVERTATWPYARRCREKAIAFVVIDGETMDVCQRHKDESEEREQKGPC